MTQTMQLLRTDQKGRVRTPRERREALLEEYDRSGASAAAFAKMCGVKYQTFVGWVQQRKRAGMAGPVKAVPLVEVSLAAEPAVSTEVPVVVRLPGGAQLELSASGQVPLVAELVRALAVGGGIC
jgi:transposase-like protein